MTITFPATVVPATGCPHYIPASSGATTCSRCARHPVVPSSSGAARQGGRRWR